MAALQGAKLALAARSGAGGGGRWVVFCCDCSNDLIQAGAVLGLLAAARREAVGKLLSLQELPQLLLYDSKVCGAESSSRVLGGRPQGQEV